MTWYGWYGELGLTTGQSLVRKRTFSPVCLDPGQTTLLDGPIAPAQTDLVRVNVAKILWAAGSRWDELMPSYPLSLLTARLTRGQNVDCSG